MKLLLLKLLLTLGVVTIVAFPFYFPAMGQSILWELQLVGVVPALFIVLGFLSLVFLYCRDLSQTLAAIAPAERTATPQSVWWMFAIPYNFVEDFFIIYHVSASLKNHYKHHPKQNLPTTTGLALGMGWCVAQIISLFPGLLGFIGGLIAIVLWIIHWRFIRSVNRRLG